MQEFWKNLSKVEYFGNGYLKCNGRTDAWACEFWVAQLFNGRMIFQVSQLSPSDFDRVRNLSGNTCLFALDGLANENLKISLSGMNINWAMQMSKEGDYFEGQIISPGYVEIAYPDDAQDSTSRIICEVTNLSIGGEHSITINIGRAKIEIQRISHSTEILRHAGGLSSARILSILIIDFDPSKPIDQNNLVLKICNLLTLAQRSYVQLVAIHYLGSDGHTMKIRYEEPVFNYPPFSRPLIPSKALGEFLETTIEKYERQLLLWKLPWAIDYYVQALALGNLLSQSIGFFTALETLKCAFLERPENKNIEHYVTKRKFKNAKIAQQVLRILGDAFNEFRFVVPESTDESEILQEEKHILKSKVGELNRRAYRLVLRKMFQELKVSVSDEDLGKLLKLRNKIIHCGTPDYEEDPEISETTRITLKFSSLLEKTFLAILEYKGNFELYDSSVGVVV